MNVLLEKIHDCHIRTYHAIFCSQDGSCFLYNWNFKKLMYHSKNSQAIQAWMKSSWNHFKAVLLFWPRPHFHSMAVFWVNFTPKTSDIHCWVLKKYYIAIKEKLYRVVPPEDSVYYSNRAHSSSETPIECCRVFRASIGRSISIKPFIKAEIM